MRVITGSAKGRKLVAPPGLEVRPTSAMAKEAVFSILQLELENAVVLDLFAGSGQMGIEALSRGARSCVFVDQARESQKAIKENLKHTQLEQQSRLVPMEAQAYLRTTSPQFDIAFLDPPYQKGVWEQLLPLTAAAMKLSGVIVCETDRKEDTPEQAGTFAKHREYRYGKAKISVYRSVESAEEE